MKYVYIFSSLFSLYAYAAVLTVSFDKTVADVTVALEPVAILGTGRKTFGHFTDNGRFPGTFERFVLNAFSWRK